MIVHPTAGSHRNLRGGDCTLAAQGASFAG
jgi:hypothetical protein